MDILHTIQNRTRPRNKAHFVEELPCNDVVGRILSFLDARSLARAEAVCRPFQVAAQMVWKDWSLVPTKFLRFDDDHRPGRMNNDDTPKLVVRKWLQARHLCEQQAAIVREYFFDRRDTEEDIQGFTRLPHLHRNVLLAKFVDKYDFFVQVALVRRNTSESSGNRGVAPRIGDVEMMFEGFLTPSCSLMKGAKYVKLIWNLEDVWRRRLRMRWKSADQYLQSFSQDCQTGQSFRPMFVSGNEVPEVTISAVGGGACGKPRLVFVTGGWRPSSTDGGIVLMDRISEQHPMLTHHFGTVPKVSLTFRPDRNYTCFESMELDFSGSSR